MLTLKPSNDQAFSPPDLSDRSALTSDGTIVCEEGSLQAVWTHQGPVLEIDPVRLRRILSLTGAAPCSR
jgi:hypothetical protein